MWSLKYSNAFLKEVSKLDKQTLKRVRDYLKAAASLPDPRKKGKALTGNFAGYWRYRVGDYRILVEIRDKEMVVMAVSVGHRRDVYRQR
jgi:mRNA interferase RelE/StbE